MPLHIHSRATLSSRNPRDFANPPMLPLCFSLGLRLRHPLFFLVRVGLLILLLQLLALFGLQFGLFFENRS